MDCASQLDRAIGGLNAINPEWLFNHNSPLLNLEGTNIYPIGNNIINAYRQALDYSLQCDFSLLERSLNIVNEKIDQQMLDASNSNSDLARRVASCMKTAEKQMQPDLEKTRAQINKIYMLGNCIMLQYPGY